MIVRKVDSSNFAELVLNSDKPCVVSFYSKGCHLCRGLHPIYERLSEKYVNRLKFFKIDADAEPSFSDEYLDGGIPTIQLFSKDIPPVLIEYPEEPDELSGYSRKYLDQWLYFYLLSYTLLKGKKNND
jgi:thiol-disulfide isomerase/thioredoxin